MLVVALACGGRASGCVNMTWLLVLTGGAVVVGCDTVPMRRAEAARDPLAFDGSKELHH